MKPTLGAEVFVVVDRISRILESIPVDLWEPLPHAVSELAIRQWWHTKWYEEDERSEDGFAPHTIRRSPESVIPRNSEVPFNRKLFYESNGRFAPQGTRVAFFASDFATASCETMNHFRGSQATPEAVRQYVGGSGPCDEDGYGYPLSYQLDCNARLIDIRSPSNRLFTEIAVQGDWPNAETFASEIALSSTPNAIQITQEIARRAHELGFNGIWYRSAQTPSGVFVGSGECLVLFEGEDLLREFDERE